LNHFIDWKMFKEPAFVSYLLGTFLLVLGLCIPIVYLESYASVIGIKNQALVSYILPIYLAANTCGCFGINVFAKWLGPINLMAISISLSGVMVFILLKVTTEGGLIFMVFILGFLAAAPVSLQAAFLVKISPDPRVIGSRIGCGYLASTLGNLVGPPIAGAILDRYGYDATWIFSACMYLTAASLFLICRGFLTRWKLFVAT
jgi:predicted MFS family arabinose efflux permease